MIEDAYRLGEAIGPVGLVHRPGRAIPDDALPGSVLAARGRAGSLPHEYLRDGTAKVLTLFHPADGRVRLHGVTSCPNAVLHPWLKRELAAILAGMPEPEAVAAAAPRRRGSAGRTA